MDNFSAGMKEGEHQDLLSLVFSWTINDVLNNNLYINKIDKIPDVFLSTDQYFNSFKWPLIEETRADYCSGLESVGHAPACEISKIWVSSNYKPPKDLYYDITTKMLSDFDNSGGTHYEPECGDLFAVTSVRPRSIADLIKPDEPFHFGYVSRSSSDEEKGKIEILSSEKIERVVLKRKSERLFITYLVNLTTNVRIWTAINPYPGSKNLGVVQNVLHYNPLVDDDCSICISEQSCNSKKPKVLECISSFGLDDSQREAVSSSISARNCSHQEYNVKLIWGPPGTGKTKTVASLLFVLLQNKWYRTLTCAPTNVAVIQVAKRLVTLFLESRNYDSYGLGDILLFGNEKRMKIDDHFELVDVFLNYRVKLLQECLRQLTGWKPSLESMLYLLRDPQARYDAYLVQNTKANDNVDKKVGTNNVEATNAIKAEGGRTDTKAWKKVIDQTVRENADKNKKGKRNSHGRKAEKDSKESDDQEAKVEECMSYDEFIRKSFCSLAERLVVYAETFYTHLPTSHLPPSVAKQMIRLADLLRIYLESARKSASQFSQLFKMKRKEILAVLKFLHGVFPDLRFDGSIRNFCMDNAWLMFCTASGAIKVKSHVDMVIIDEAAQLKECESAISLQIPGLKTAILIGDDKQLPAMVQSKALENTNFGRSLFQRLVSLGKKRHLLNIQYRMHPSISSFPNREFYDGMIIDAACVKESNYAKKFLKGGMYGSYSFINVADGREDFKKGHSPRNFEEADVVERIIAKLFKDYYCIAKQKVSVGVISPYKGQVGLLQEKIEKKYIPYKDKFCIGIRSVDGFQGGEEDIIIISTVRSNGSGAVGFLSNFQRTNVALTRARFCQWIVGSGSTLGKSRSVWNKLILDAKNRGCFYDAYDDIDIDPIIQDTPAGKSGFFGYLKLDKARWKVIYNRDFRISILNSSLKTQIRVKELLHKIASGWRQSNSEKPMNVIFDDPVATSLLELYQVDENLNLAWTVDVLKEESSYTQVIKVWDILPASWIPNLAMNFSIFFRRYTAEVKHRCAYRSFKGNLCVPMSWPLESNCNDASLTASITPICLSSKLAAMNLGVKQGESSLRARKDAVSVWKPVQRLNANLS